MGCGRGQVWEGQADGGKGEVLLASGGRFEAARWQQGFPVGPGQLEEPQVSGRVRRGARRERSQREKPQVSPWSELASTAPWPPGISGGTSVVDGACGCAPGRRRAEGTLCGGRWRSATPTAASAMTSSPPPPAGRGRSTCESTRQARPPASPHLPRNDQDSSPCNHQDQDSSPLSQSAWFPRWSPPGDL